MDWHDTGTVLNARRHGETSAILEVFTESHGRHAGLVRSASSPKIAPCLQPGTQLDVKWRGRLEAHLGTFTVEPVKSRAVATMGGRLELAALNAINSILIFALPEHKPHPMLYRRTIALLDVIGGADDWPTAYLHWELALLDEMGFGLDLKSCAVSGATKNLSHVSPKTGRAVSEAETGIWKDRLLPLPDCLVAPVAGTPEEILQGLRTTGHFLRNRLAPALGERPLPAARDRFADVLSRRC